MTLLTRARMAAISLLAKSSSDYWERRYRAGLTSGLGSYGALAEFKAEIINAFVEDNNIGSVVEFGCGDGNQLALANYPRYVGLDVSKFAIEHCRRRFDADRSKSFSWIDPDSAIPLWGSVSAELALSLDVIYHLTEDRVYRAYLDDFFRSASRFAIVYSSDHDGSDPMPHVRHRKFTDDVARWHNEFTLKDRIRNRYPADSCSDFFVYERIAT